MSMSTVVRRGCSIGGPIVGDDGVPRFTVGITTSNADIVDSGSVKTTPVNPGGLPLYRNGRVIGGRRCHRCDLSRTTPARLPVRSIPLGARTSGGEGMGDNQSCVELRRAVAVSSRHRPGQTSDAGNVVRSVRVRRRQSLHGRFWPQSWWQSHLWIANRHCLVSGERPALQSS
jgi:hypothetical protein